MGVRLSARPRFEVLDYKNGRLKVRIHATFTNFLNGTVTLGGKPIVCAYNAAFTGSDPDPGEIILEVEGPVDTTPNM